MSVWDDQNIQKSFPKRNRKKSFSVTGALFHFLKFRGTNLKVKSVFRGVGTESDPQSAKNVMESIPVRSK